MLALLYAKRFALHAGKRVHLDDYKRIAKVDYAVVVIGFMGMPYGDARPR